MRRISGRVKASFVVIILLAVVALAFGGAANSSEESSPTSTTVVEDTTTTVVDPAVCDGHVVAFADHAGAKVVSVGLQGPTSEENRREIRDYVAHDPAVLMLYYNASPLAETDPIASVDSLVTGEVKNGSCYSQEGIDRFNEWAVLWKTARIERVDSMPPGWGNTGISGGVPTHGAPPSGDTSGIMVTFVDANGNEIGKMGVMDRCANPVTPAPPAKVKPGPTDNPPPPGTSTTPPRESTTSNPPRETTTTEGGGKDHNDAHPDERVPTSPEPRRDPTTTVRPTTTAPITVPGGATPTTWDSIPPDNPRAGPGAPGSSVPPTTAAPAPPPPNTAPPTTRVGPPGSG